jgi:ribonuclease E
VQFAGAGTEDRGGERESFAATEEGRQDEQGGRRRRRGRRGGRRGRDRGRGPQQSRYEGEQSTQPYEDQPLPDTTGAPEPVESPAAAPRVEPEKELVTAAAALAQPRSVASEEAPAEAPAARPKARARSNASSGEPKLERVVVKPDHAEGEASADAGVVTSEPVRRGWWQRKLGSE